jgi:hypothetical protein
MAADGRRPVMSPGEVLHVLAGAGVARFVERVHSHLDA